MYDVECLMAMEPMQGKWASSHVDLGYTEIFCIPELTSVFFLSCASVLGDSLEFYQANRGLLTCWTGNMEFLCRQCRESCHILPRGGNLMDFLELQQEPGLYYRVTAGIVIQNSC